MGIGLWMACALIVFFAARRIPQARPPQWAGELLAAITSALALGALATALDFGGWKEPDWRAALFVVFGTALISGTIRLVRLASALGSRGDAAPPRPDKLTSA